MSWLDTLSFQRIQAGNVSSGYCIEGVGGTVSAGGGGGGGVSCLGSTVFTEGYCRTL